MARPPKYGFGNLEVGQSLEVPKNGTPDLARKVRQAANAHRRKYGARFVVRTLRDQGIVRCVRVE
jgi:hypothetical protein